jgi:hypothetical protein
MRGGLPWLVGVPIPVIVICCISFTLSEACIRRGLPAVDGEPQAV